jgi:hypothetical protein
MSSPTLVKPMAGKTARNSTYVKMEEFENCPNEEIVRGILV